MMVPLKKLLAVVVFALAFLAGHQVALKAQCSACYENPGPAGVLAWQYPIGVCPCDANISCWWTYCGWCNGFFFAHRQCSSGPPPVCWGC